MGLRHGDAQPPPFPPPSSPLPTVTGSPLPPHPFWPSHPHSGARDRSVASVKWPAYQLSGAQPLWIVGFGASPLRHTCSHHRGSLNACRRLSVISCCTLLGGAPPRRESSMLSRRAPRAESPAVGLPIAKTGRRALADVLSQTRTTSPLTTSDANSNAGVCAPLRLDSGAVCSRGPRHSPVFFFLLWVAARVMHPRDGKKGRDRLAECRTRPFRLDTVCGQESDATRTETPLTWPALFSHEIVRWIRRALRGHRQSQTTRLATLFLAFLILFTHLPLLALDTLPSCHFAFFLLSLFSCDLSCRTDGAAAGPHFWGGGFPIPFPLFRFLLFTSPSFAHRPRTLVAASR